MLGPQRRPTLDTVAASLRPGAGPIATITAGWQEREPDDGALSEQLGSRDVNLSLYRRWLDVQDRDPDFAAAERQLRGVLEEVQDDLPAAPGSCAAGGLRHPAPQRRMTGSGRTLRPRPSPPSASSTRRTWTASATSVASSTRRGGRTTGR